MGRGPEACAMPSDRYHRPQATLHPSVKLEQGQSEQAGCPTAPCPLWPSTNLCSEGCCSTGQQPTQEWHHRKHKWHDVTHESRSIHMGSAHVVKLRNCSIFRTLLLAIDLYCLAQSPRAGWPLCSSEAN